MRRIPQLVLTGLMVGLLVSVGGCASSGDSADATANATPTAAATAKPIPKNSKLAKVEIGMSEQQVRVAIGEPADIRGYPTGKNWIPFYFGGDTYRQDWKYSGQGIVVFSNSSRWTRSMKVVELRYDPNQS